MSKVRSYRLSFLCHEFPPIGGGAATALDKLTEKLAQQGHAIQALTIGSEGGQAFKAIPSREVISLGDIRKKGQSISLIDFIRSYYLLRYKAPYYLDAFRPEVIISFFAFPAGHAILPYVRRTSIPHVVSIRGYDAPGFFDERLGGMVTKIIPFFTKPVIKQASLTYANGKRLQDLVKIACKGIEAKSIPNGVIVSKPLKSIYSFREVLKIIFVGQLIPRKRILESLKGVIHFAKNYSQPIEFNIIGAGPLYAELQRESENSPENLKVNFKEYMSREDLIDFYQAHHLMVHLSIDEGVSNTLLEGLAAGLGILASKEIIYEFESLADFPGEIINDYHPYCIAESLRKMVYKEASLMQYAEKGRDLANTFSWEAHVSQFIQMIEEVV